MNVLFVMGMPYDIENKNLEFQKKFKNFDIRYYLTNYISKWSDNNIENLEKNKNYLLTEKIKNINAKYYSKLDLILLYKKYFKNFYDLLLNIMSDDKIKLNDESYYSSHYFSQVQETLNEYVYYCEILKNEKLDKNDKIIFISTNMSFVENDFDFLTCFSDKIHHFINDTSEFFTNRPLMKSDFHFFDYDFTFLAWNFWWTNFEKFSIIVDELEDNLLYIYNKMYINNNIPIVDSEVARGYIFNRYIDNNGPVNIVKNKPDFEKIKYDFCKEFKEVETIQ